MEPEGKNLEACLGARARLWSDPPQFLDTIAEGIMTQQVTLQCSAMSYSAVVAFILYSSTGWAADLPAAVRAGGRRGDGDGPADGRGLPPARREDEGDGGGRQRGRRRRRHVRAGPRHGGGDQGGRHPVRGQRGHGHPALATPETGHQLETDATSFK